MASTQIMRSSLRQEQADVIKFLTRLVRAWKNLTWSHAFAIEQEFRSTGLSFCFCLIFPMWPCLTLSLYICSPKISCCWAYKSPWFRGPLAVGWFVQEFWPWGVAEAEQTLEQQLALGSAWGLGMTLPRSEVMGCEPGVTRAFWCLAVPKIMDISSDLVSAGAAAVRFGRGCGAQQPRLWF